MKYVLIVKKNLLTFGISACNATKRQDLSGQLTLKQKNCSKKSKIIWKLQQAKDT